MFSLDDLHDAAIAVVQSTLSCCFVSEVVAGTDRVDDMPGGRGHDHRQTVSYRCNMQLVCYHTHSHVQCE